MNIPVLISSYGWSAEADGACVADVTLNFPTALKNTRADVTIKVPIIDLTKYQEELRASVTNGQYLRLTSKEPDTNTAIKVLADAVVRISKEKEDVEVKLKNAERALRELQATVLQSADNLKRASDKATRSVG